MGQVRLEPHIEFRGSYMQAEFKIGISRMYVLRSISKMAAAIENLETVSYGAQLTFLHCIGAFEPGSRKMAQFLVENEMCIRDRDKRVVTISLAEAGKEQLGSIIREFVRLGEKVTGVLTAEELETAGRILDKVLLVLTEEQAEDKPAVPKKVRKIVIE